MGLSRAGRLQLLQHQIASAALSGVAAEAIDRDVIVASNCSEEDKAALRLYAFSFLPRFDQRRIALDRLCPSPQEETEDRGRFMSPCPHRPDH
jgi:hypothetical protein